MGHRVNGDTSFTIALVFVDRYSERFTMCSPCSWRAICEEIDAVEEVRVKLLSAIGARTDQPQVADVEIRARGGLTGELKEMAAAIADAWLENIDGVTDLILEEKAPVY